MIKLQEILTFSRVGRNASSHQASWAPAFISQVAVICSPYAKSKAVGQGVVSLQSSLKYRTD